MPTLTITPASTTRPAIINAVGSGLNPGTEYIGRVDGAIVSSRHRALSDGTYSFGISIGSSSSLGTHTAQIRNSSNKTTIAQATFTVVDTAPPPPPPPPPPPTDGEVISPGTSIKAKLDAGVRKFILRGGTHKFSLGSSDSPYKDVSISAYPGEVPVIDGEGVQSLLYIGTQSGTWKLSDLTIRNFLPEDQGVIGIGDSCRIEMTRVKMIGSGIPSGNNDHGVYFHGTGSGLLTDCDITAFPGAAIQSYRGDPQSIVVNGGKMHGLYIGAFIYSGHMDFTGVDIRGTLNYDVDIQLPASATFTNCTGRGADGKPKVYGPHS